MEDTRKKVKVGLAEIEQCEVLEIKVVINQIKEKRNAQI